MEAQAGSRSRAAGRELATTPVHPARLDQRQAGARVLGPIDGKERGKKESVDFANKDQRDAAGLGGFPGL